jgi:hypothetical protein
MNLIYDEKTLDDSKTLNYYLINKDSIVTIYKRRPPKQLPIPHVFSDFENDTNQFTCMKL